MTTVATEHIDYTAALKVWEKMEDVTTSEAAVHARGEAYLPKLDKMTDSDYDAYRLRASFPLFTKHTLQNFVGMAMRKDVMTAGLSAEFLKNVDGKGTTLTDYVKRVLRTYLRFARCGTLVEYSGGRPKLLLYGPTSIINWKTDIVDDVEVLVLVVLRESKDKSTDIFTSDVRYQYRVLKLEKQGNGKHKYIQAIYDDAGNLVTEHKDISKRHKSLNRIPFVIHGGWEVEQPPLIQIAEQNLAFYRLDADYKHGLHYTALPTPYTVGVDDEKDRPNTLGASEIWHLPDGCSAGMLEFRGAGLGEFKNAKEEVKDNIVTLSSRILAPPMNLNETATAAAIRNAGDTASLAEIVGMLSRELEICATLAQDWKYGVNDKIVVQINNDFLPTILSGSDVASYVASYLKGGMSFYTLFNVLKKGEIVEGDRTLEEELKDIRAEILERNADEIALQEKLSAIQGKIEAKSNYIPQEKDGEGANKGQNFKEN